MIETCRTITGLGSCWKPATHYLYDGRAFDTPSVPICADHFRASCSKPSWVLVQLIGQERWL